ncbi:4-hydroxyphenylacetaldehyde oxime monooxygenase-like [Miscanthus floridulus]|uniref:4-hydroxyphenylacetaldehyde oxime monooxygenase-like n=1 Tax=Miscanthus floridulus TaxID=154761 RepID=UPI00345AB96C
MTAAALFPGALLQQWRLPATLVVAVAFSLVSILLLSWSRTRRSRRRPALNLPPGPQTLPLLGNLHQIGPLPHRGLWALARQHGPVMLLRLGSVPTVVASSPEAAREVMKTHDVHCCSRPAMSGPRRLTYEYKDVAFALYGDHVRDMRKLFILELLSMRRVQAAWDARVAQAEKLVLNLTRAGANPVALNEHIFSAVDGIIGTVVFGEIYGTEQFNLQFLNILSQVMDMLGSFSADDFFPSTAGRFIDCLTGVTGRRDRIFQRFDAFLEEIIEGHLNTAHSEQHSHRNPRRSDLVQALIGLFKDNNASTVPFTRDHVKAMLFDTFVGGIHTTSITMVWAMAEMIQHPSVLKSVQDEIRDVVGGKEMASPDDVSKLKLLKMVVKETLRMHPPLTLLLPRETIQQVNIRGYDVPANTRIIVNAWAIGRDPDIWEDPEEFNPERFMGSDVDFNGANFEFLPFGSGRRICPGMAMAVTNMEFILANLLHCFDWELPEGARKEDMSMQEAGSLAFHKKTPLLLVPRRYQTSH